MEHVALSSRAAEHVDVLVVGAGLSGIGQAWHLQDKCPGRSLAILEARDAIGGTWDLFRYPGVRSDSDMHTLGYGFRPWTGERSIADGASILRYIRDTARESGIERHIRFGTRVTAARWSGEDARWTVTATGPDGAAVTMTCGWLCMCSGYYDYARGYAPDFAGAEWFEGRIVHPQFWPDDLDHAGKRVVVIGSGATAMTLVPAMADTAAHVTLLQRSPTYVVSRPEKDRLANWLRRWLPAKAAYRLIRWKNVLLGLATYRLARRRPETVKKAILKGVRGHLGPDYDVATHFTPRYRPWDQRICLVPDADLFRAIGAGRVEVVTDTVDSFTAQGLRLASGRELAADIVVTATGLELRLLGDVAFTIGGASVDLATRVQYKGMMFDGVPNLSVTFGYTNASWTLKADLIATYVCRLLNTLRRRGMRQATPHNDDPAMALEPSIDFTSGYVRRALDRIPRQGTRAPWRLHQNYARDVMALRFGSVDRAMIFSNPAPHGRQRPAAEEDQE